MAKAGDVCTLKSGGAVMTVERIDGSLVRCVWFQCDESDRWQVERETFDIDSLEFGKMEAAQCQTTP